MGPTMSHQREAVTKTIVSRYARAGKRWILDEPHKPPRHLRPHH